jgi:hypothetical protein
MLYGKWLKVTKACEPDEIQWQNIGYSGTNRFFRKYLFGASLF